MRWSIRNQFLLPLILMLLGLVVIAVWAGLDSARHARRTIAGQIHDIVRTIEGAHFPFTQHVLDMMENLTGAEFFLNDAANVRLATFPGRPDAWPAPEPSPAATPSLGSRVAIEERAYLCRGVAIKSPHANAGATLYVLYPESLLDDAVWQAVRSPLIVGLSGGLAALALTIVSGRRLVRRIQDLERRTRLIAAGDFSPMPLPHRRDELRDLAESVNEMAARLKQFREAMAKAERQRLLGQVSSGLAHQLRNAVTGAKLALQLHAETCRGGDADALDVADRQLVRMAADLQRFFDLGQDAGRREPCALRDVIDEAYSLVLPQCKHLGVELHWLPADSGRVVGDGGLLGHLALNLISNAIEAAGPGGTVDITCDEHGPQVRFEVSDTGPGPPPEIADRLFEAFVTGRAQGIGLGLAVAQQVADSHGGSIGWRRDGNRTVFFVLLPKANPQGP